MGKYSLAQIAPADTAIGRPSATARRLVDASVSANIRRAYAGALGQLDDAALAAYLILSGHERRRLPSDCGER